MAFKLWFCFRCYNRLLKCLFLKCQFMSPPTFRGLLSRSKFPTRFLHRLESSSTVKSLKRQTKTATRWPRKLFQSKNVLKKYKVVQVQGCVLIVFSKGKNYHSLNTFWTIQYGSLSSTSSLRVLLISFRVTLHVHKINVKKEGEKKTEQSLPKKTTWC